MANIGTHILKEAIAKEDLDFSPNKKSFSARLIEELHEENAATDLSNLNPFYMADIARFSQDKDKYVWLPLEWLHLLSKSSLDDRYRLSPKKFESGDESGSLQQIDLARPLYLKIAEEGLPAAYKELTGNTAKSPPEGTVLIVGAGMSGMVAAYELTRAGYHDVKILEMSERFGGRVKTLDMKNGFDRGLHTDAGAMRIPLPPDNKRPIDQSIHYLTDYYSGPEKFNLMQVPFSNQSDNAYYHFYGDTIKISEWNQNPKKNFDHYWPGWDKDVHCYRFKTINDYYDRTVDVVIDLLKLRLKWSGETWVGQALAWSVWTQNWCQFSFGSFLRSTLDGIKTQLNWIPIAHKKEYEEKLEELRPLLPWRESAITAYMVFNYTLEEDVSLVAEVQEKMGKWWANDMHSLKGGLSALPNAFADKEKGDVEKLIVYNRMVSKVEIVWEGDQLTGVRVHGVFTSSGEPFVEEGRSVMLTVPLHVLRGIDIVSVSKTKRGSEYVYKPAPSDKKFPMKFQKAVQDISYSPSTKIMLQYKRQFWQGTPSPADNINGGFSKTNMPIGQLHYPTILTPFEQAIQVDVPHKPIEEQKGILMVYTWKAEALLWGALTEDEAIRLAVDQIERIHPNTRRLFEVGVRQAWASDPTTLGAFAMLRPREYLSVLFLMLKPWNNVFFAGEAISFANGWIQGALGSGLRAALQLFYRDQNLMIQ